MRLLSKVCLILMALSGPACAATTRPAATQPRWEAEIAAFEAADRRQFPPQGSVLFVGSSSIRMWTTLAEDLPELTVIRRGFGGSTIRDSIDYAGRIVVPYRPKRIVLYAGDNDIANGLSPQRVAEDFRQFVTRVRRDLPDVRVDFIAIKPSLARWRLVDRIRQANALVEAYARETAGVGYIDVFTPMLGEDGRPRAEYLVEDGLHLSRAGYRMWGRVIGEHLAGRQGAP